jgi:hypothetical protein
MIVGTLPAVVMGKINRCCSAAKEMRELDASIEAPPPLERSVEEAAHRLSEEGGRIDRGQDLDDLIRFDNLWWSRSDQRQMLK